MTNEELVELVQQGIDVQENMGKLYEQNKKIIYKFVLPYSKIIEIDDLMQEAYFGLYQAAIRFKNDYNCKFITYAYHWIVNKVNIYCKNNGKLKRLPAHVLEMISKYYKYVNNYEDNNDCKPDDCEIMEFLHINKNQLANLRKYMNEDSTTSLQSVLGEDLLLEDTIASDIDTEAEVCEKLLNKQLKTELWNEVEKLPDRKGNIIKQRYRENLTREEIAKKENLTRERIRQIEYTGLKILKQKEKIRDIAKEYYYNTSMAYSGNLKSFKNNGGSVVENLVIKKIESEKEILARMAQMEQRRKKLLATMS